MHSKRQLWQGDVRRGGLNHLWEFSKKVSEALTHEKRYFRNPMFIIRFSVFESIYLIAVYTLVDKMLKVGRHKLFSLMRVLKSEVEELELLEFSDVRIMTFFF